MSELIEFIPKAAKNALTNYIEFLHKARTDYCNLVSHDDWCKGSWNVTAVFVRKGKPNVRSWLHFYRLNTTSGRGDDFKGELFDNEFIEFARAYLSYKHSVAPVMFDATKVRLESLCFLDASFKAFGLPANVRALSVPILNTAIEIGCSGVTPAVQYKRARAIEEVFRFCREHHFLNTPFNWKHGKRKAKEVTERIGSEFAAQRAAKLPTQKALDVLAFAYNEPKNFQDRIFTAVTAICICVPIRIHEVLQLREGCGCNEQRTSDAGILVPAFGIRANPGKGHTSQIKWVPDIMEDLASEAILRLRQLSIEARTIATWYVKNPKKLYLPPEWESLRGKQHVTDMEVGILVNTQGKQWILGNFKTPQIDNRGGRLHVSFDEFEQVILRQLPIDFPLHNGHAAHSYGESLIIVRHGSMKASGSGIGSLVMFQPISIDAYSVWLTGTTGKPSVFERYGFVEDDGSDIHQTSHGFRHWLNDIAHRRGIGALDIASWSGRDPAQNKYYDHQTPAQFHDQLIDLAEKAGGIGPLFEAAENLSENSVISKAEFLSVQIGSAHHTEFGACIHDYTLLPCQKYGDCLDCAENVFIKADSDHRARIAARHELTARQLEAARRAMDDGEYGADLWVADHQSKLARLATVLAIHDDETIHEGTIVNLPVRNDDDDISLALRQRSIAG